MLERARDGANDELVLKIGSKGSERSRRMLRARRWHRRPEQSDKRREAALTELVTLQAQVVSLSSDRSSALAAQVSLVNESRR